MPDAFRISMLSGGSITPKEALGLDFESSSAIQSAQRIALGSIIQDFCSGLQATLHGKGEKHFNDLRGIETPGALSKTVSQKKAMELVAMELDKAKTKRRVTEAFRIKREAAKKS